MNKSTAGAQKLEAQKEDVRASGDIQPERKKRPIDDEEPPSDWESEADRQEEREAEEARKAKQGKEAEAVWGAEEARKDHEARQAAEANHARELAKLEEQQHPDTRTNKSTQGRVGHGSRSHKHSQLSRDNAGTKRPPDGSGESERAKGVKRRRPAPLIHGPEIPVPLPKNRDRRYNVVTEKLNPGQRKGDHFKNHMRYITAEAQLPARLVRIRNQQDTEDEHELFSNRLAGDLWADVRTWICRLEDELQKAHEKIADLESELPGSGDSDAQLNISFPDRIMLMEHQLHHRYRTIWQMAVNADILPYGEQSKSIYEDHPGHEIIHLYGEYATHQERYELISGMAHGGNLRADLLAGTSKYLEVWQDDPKSQAPHCRAGLYRALFERVYCLTYDEAQWLVTAADKHNVTAVKACIRLIERFRLAADTTYKEHRQVTTKFMDGRLRRLRELDKKHPAIVTMFKAEAKYKIWVGLIKDQIRKQKAKKNVFLISQADEYVLRDKTRQFYREACEQGNNWNLLNRDTFFFWKPAESFQKKYDFDWI